MRLIGSEYRFFSKRSLVAALANVSTVAGTETKDRTGDRKAETNRKRETKDRIGDRKAETVRKSRTKDRTRDRKAETDRRT